ncbi:hypothetical protein TEA_013888 [Camellia sinensis var. sinensis]|uniref:Glycosyl hydrolase family 13 catalytic domain-containing protein n=1 Tax=Camellia sinensis var. sinensis TaxID=542762 RepID=A0A4S4E4H8_CAMSN|nr:hypothetical protein TEA_013888 [Camellia sinensis var. sinensis]
MHVDGFRFDLASILTRGSSLWDALNVYGNPIEGDMLTTGTPLSSPPLIDMISNDPILRGVKVGDLEGWGLQLLWCVPEVVGRHYDGGCSEIEGWWNRGVGHLCGAAIGVVGAAMVVVGDNGRRISRACYAVFYGAHSVLIVEKLEMMFVGEIDIYCWTPFLVAEAWDCGGLYQVGMFPHWGIWSEWNGKYRDIVRQYIKGTDGFAGAFAECLCGSPNLYQEGGRKPWNSINFVCAHDGFSLADLVMYNNKHNLANGEDNNDGENHNNSWNCGQLAGRGTFNIMKCHETGVIHLVPSCMHITFAAGGIMTAGGSSGRLPTWKERESNKRMLGWRGKTFDLGEVCNPCDKWCHRLPRPNQLRNRELSRLRCCRSVWEAIWSTESNTPISSEQLREMKYNEAVVREVVRIRAPATLVPHFAGEDSLNRTSSWSRGKRTGFIRRTF